MESRRRAEIAQGHDPYTKVALSTITYLREAADRGALVQVLTQSPEVREALKAERAATQRADRARVVGNLTETYGMPRDAARAMTSVLTAMCLRAGRLVATGTLNLDAAERLTLAMTMTANRDLVRRYRGSTRGA